MNKDEGIHYTSPEREIYLFPLPAGSSGSLFILSRQFPPAEFRKTPYTEGEGWRTETDCPG